nr:HIT domain-containing protein [Candidatus Levybacteria bacterium]
MDKCIFCKIRDREIPKEFTYEDDDIMVFPDINPVKPVHLLIISKKHYADLSEVRDETLLAKLMLKTREMAKENDLDKNGYRVLINGGGAQAIMHLHIHLFGPMDQTTLL